MKRYTTMLLLILLLSFGCSKSSMEIADTYRNKRHYEEAAKMYSRLYKMKRLDKTIRLDALRLSAECYRKSGNYSDAERVYKLLLKQIPNDSIALYYIASLSLRNTINNDYDAFQYIRKCFVNYLKVNPNDEWAKFNITSCDSSLSWLDIPEKAKVNLFIPIGITKCNFGLISGSIDDKTLYFCSNRFVPTYQYCSYPHNNIFEINCKTNKKGKLEWNEPVFLNSLNKKRADDGTLCFNSNYSVVYFTSCKRDYISQCKLFKANVIGDSFFNIEILSFCKDDKYNYAQPALSVDNKYLYFSSDKPEGFGDYDIYSIEILDSSQFGEIKNLGPNVNTPKSELFPTINKHDNFLYFSSDGRIGMGGLDLYKTQQINNNWTVAENLKPPFNSRWDDLCVSFLNSDSHKGYFTSSREYKNGNLCDCIYEFEVLN